MDLSVRAAVAVGGKTMMLSELIERLQKLIAESKADHEFRVETALGGYPWYSTIEDVYLCFGRIHIEI